MRVIISAGGTGGHIYPALAIINKIKEKEPNSEFLYIGTHNRMEKDIIPSMNIPFRSIEIYGLNRKKIFKNVKVVSCLFKAYKECKSIIKEYDPDIVIGVGGYVTTPVIKAAKKLGYKTFIHEQNSIPGKANLYLEKYTDKIGVSFESSMKYFDNKKVIFTGNPCSENSLKIEAASKKEFGLSENKKTVLFVMGSLGSSKMNNFLINTMHKFDKKDYEIIFVTGKNDYEKISKIEFPKNIKVVPYIDNMTRVMKFTDLIISRAGASTLSEVIALNVPSILIPSPYVTNNHQYKNAMDLKNKNACILIEEKDLNEDILIKNIDSILNDEEKINEMKNNLELMSIKNSATKIYDVIRNLVGR
ncbi:MAG TPA: undecaprenyldiphospho-muramoylpentapeptide beta-N-acetylglucosaminyltransferase [Bacilli bacterium]|nr:undecaprenyldiphospho-muramoylpentapeptide beta-N-acetylglucosaminyltransferase [Bacilli bacterium]